MIILHTFITTISVFIVESKRTELEEDSNVNYPYIGEGHRDANSEQTLLRNLLLLSGYDKDARGVESSSDIVTVTLDMLLLRIHGLDERSQVLTSTGLLITEWYDFRLRWDPRDYYNTTDVVLRPTRIWLPELALMNGAVELTPDFRRIRALVRYDGLVHWEPGGVFSTTCDIDIRYFPFDQQKCIIQFGAWAYYSARMNITNRVETILIDGLKKNGEWLVLSTSANWRENVIPCCPVTRYSYIEYTITLERRYTFYIMNIILPCALLSVLELIVFCLPPDGGEKISLGISVLLAFTVFLLMVAENVPRTSLHIPIIVIYLTSIMALGTGSVCLTVFVLNVHHQNGQRPLPNWSRKLIMGILARLLCVRVRQQVKQKPSLRKGVQKIINGFSIFASDTEASTHNKGSHKKYTSVATNSQANAELTPRREGGSQFNYAIEVKDYSSDWKEMAQVFDRLFFCIVFVLLSLTTLYIFCVPLLYRNRNDGNVNI